MELIFYFLRSYYTKMLEVLQDVMEKNRDIINSPVVLQFLFDELKIPNDEHLCKILFEDTLPIEDKSLFLSEYSFSPPSIKRTDILRKLIQDPFFKLIMPYDYHLQNYFELTNTFVTEKYFEVEEGILILKTRDDIVNSLQTYKSESIGDVIISHNYVFVLTKYKSILRIFNSQVCECIIRSENTMDFELTSIPHKILIRIAYDTVILFDFLTYKTERTFKTEAEIQCFLFHEDKVIIGSKGVTIFSNKEIILPSNGEVWGLETTELGKLVVETYNQPMTLWDIETGKLDFVFCESNARPIIKHNKLACISDNMKIWNLSTGKCEITIKDYNFISDQHVFIDDWIFGVSNDYHTLTVYDLKGQILYSLNVKSQIESFELLSRKRLLIVFDKFFEVWDLSQNKCQITITESYLSYVVLPNEKLLVNARKSLKVFNPETGICDYEIKGNYHNLQLFSKRLTTTTEGGAKLQIWN